MTEVGDALQECAGSVDRIDDPDAATGQSRGIILGLLGEPAIVRTRLAKPLLDERVDGHIRIATGVPPGFSQTLTSVLKCCIANTPASRTVATRSA